MLSVILTILKVIGLILLGIIGLVVLILLTVLLVPIRYEADAAVQDKKPLVHARVSWLMRFVCVRVRYDEGLHYLVKILGFTLLDSDKPKEQKKPKQKSEKSKAAKKSRPASKSKPAAKSEAGAGTAAKEQIKTVEQSSTQASSAKKEESAVQTADSKKMQEQQKPVSQKDKSADKKTEPVNEEITEEKPGIKEKISGLIEKIREYKAKADEILAYIQSPAGKKLARFIKRKLYRLMRHLLPKKFRTNARIGLADPSTTGKILGISYMLYPIYGDHIHVEGEFEEEVIEGDLYIKGRIRLGTLVLIGVQVILNKEVRMWIRKLTKRQEVNRK